MTETEILALRDAQLESFSDSRCKKAVANWQPVVERAPNGWLLYRIGKDKGIAYTEGEDWENLVFTLLSGRRM